LNYKFVSQNQIELLQL